MVNSAFIVKKEISINAEPSAVWDALTNPEKTKDYFFNCKVFSNWKTGSDIIFKRKMFFFFNFEMRGKILKVEPRKILRYILSNSGSSTFSTVTDTIHYQDGKTILSITDDVGAGKDAQERYEKSEKGWDKILIGLKEYVESEKAA